MAETKDRGPIYVGPLAKLRGQLLRRPAGIVGTFFSRGGFTLPAVAQAQQYAPQVVLRWTGDEIDLALRRRRMVRGLTIKYRAAVELGASDFSLLQRGLL